MLLSHGRNNKMHRNKGKIYLKKDCVGCKAFHKGSCRLEIRREIYLTSVRERDHHPLEPCPKPRTEQKLQKALLRL